ncbi:MAG TPA: hypothetical protein DHU63_09655 [Candidatus Marinimicrobia bacterium]|nr:hypothetical protein [Candidatus Neomarinimicrobiota bacterium]
MPSCPLIRLNIAKYPVILWLVALAITLASARYQRHTGPTYPVEDEMTINGQTISYELTRSATTGSDTPVILALPDSSVQAFLQYRRYKSNDEWTTVPMLQQNDGTVVAELPSQPAAGKVMYKVLIKSGPGDLISLTGEKPVIIRYKGHVPLGVLIPHIFFIFGAMLLSNRTGMEALDGQNGKPQNLLYWTIAVVFIGGLIMGPLVQKYAFDAYWTGVPFGWDLTDNKTLIAFLGWLFAWWKNRGEHRSRLAIIFAALLMFAIFMIPHSVLGSELDYTKMPE